MKRFNLFGENFMVPYDLCECVLQQSAEVPLNEEGNLFDRSHF